MAWKNLILTWLKEKIRQNQLWYMAYEDPVFATQSRILEAIKNAMGQPIEVNTA